MTDVGTSTHVFHDILVNKDLEEMGTFLSELPGLKVPTGFHSVLESFSKEVLRAQPPDIVEFGVQYFEGQMNKRPGRRGLAGMKKK